MKPQEPSWVFGYGSLIWRQDFPFLDARRARIRGWARRFWQGSHDHRGIPEAPGRVVTLIESPEAECLGRAFLVEAEVFSHLDHREKNGYERHTVDILFEDRSAPASSPGVVYVAPVGNFAYLGEAPIDEIAAQIRDSKGPSGSNVEYLRRLAESLRELGAADTHVFSIEKLLK